MVESKFFMPEIFGHPQQLTLKPAVAAVAASTAPSKFCWAQSALAYAKFLGGDNRQRFENNLRRTLCELEHGPSIVDLPIQNGDLP